MTTATMTRPHTPSLHSLALELRDAITTRTAAQADVRRLARRPINDQAAARRAARALARYDQANQEVRAATVRVEAVGGIVQWGSGGHQVTVTDPTGTARLRTQA